MNHKFWDDSDMRSTARENGSKCRLLLNHVFSSLFTGLCTLLDPYLFHNQPPHSANTLLLSPLLIIGGIINSTYILGSLSHIYTPLLPFLHYCAKFPWKCLFLPSCYCLFCKQKINLNCGGLKLWVPLFKLKSPLTPFSSKKALLFFLPVIAFKINRKFLSPFYWLAAIFSLPVFQQYCFLSFCICVPIILYMCTIY